MPLRPSVLVCLLVACSDGGSPPSDAGADAAAVLDAAEAPAADRPPEAPAGDLGADVTDARPPVEVPPAALLEIDPPLHDFGDVPKDEVVTKHFRVNNVGGTSSGSLDIKLENPASDPNAYVIVSNGCESTLEPEATCELEIRYMANVIGLQQGLLTATASPGGMASAELKARAVP